MMSVIFVMALIDMDSRFTLIWCISTQITILSLWLPGGPMWGEEKDGYEWEKAVCDDDDDDDDDDESATKMRRRPQGDTNAGFKT